MTARSRRVAAVAAAIALAAAVTGIELSGAAFSAESANPSNQFAAASSFNFRVASGTYTGDGVAGHQITGLGFWPNLVIIKGDNAQTAVARSSTMAATKPLAGPTVASAGMITSLFDGGFSLDASARVNANGISYTWVAFATSPGRMTARSYVGTGSSGTQSITGLGYSPEYVIVLPANNGNAVMRAGGMSASFRFDGNNGAANQINSLDADGFTAGSGLNANNVTFHYLAWNETPGLIDLSSYSGDGDGQSIAGVGFQPDYALVRSTSSTGAPRAAIHRPAAVTGTSSLRFNAAVNDSDAITALEADGIQVGANTDANANGVPYALISFKDEGP